MRALKGKSWFIIGIILTTLNILFFIYNNNITKDEGFDLIFPYMDNLERDERESFYRSDYSSLKIVINKTAESNLDNGESYGYYFESLNSGSWVGINEKVSFFPLSLRKVPLAAALYREVEAGRLSMEQMVEIEKGDLMDGGPLYNRGCCYQMMMKDLLHYMLYYSDNTATQVIYRKVGDVPYVDAVIRMGIAFEVFKEIDEDPNFPLSPKQYSNIWRSLYYSNYLSRKDSQDILTRLSTTSFKEGIPAGLPDDVTVAHKVGYVHTKGVYQYHDCGIVYMHDNPYILCIMTSGMPNPTAFIAELSKATYDHILSLS